MLLLDTNVVSEFRKIRLGRADPNVARWASGLWTRDLHVSAITVHELEIGVLRVERRDPAQAARLRTWLDKAVLAAFDGRVLPVDIDVALRAASLHVPASRPINDAFIAATALVHGLTIATRNVGDYLSTGVTLLNPWEARVSP